MKKKYLKIIAVFFLVLASLFVFNEYSAQTVLRIYDYQTKEIYVEVPAKEGDQLFFGWIHSWEKIPWHEYYHIDASHDLILDTIAFPAFGAGIPENKGTKVWIKDGCTMCAGAIGWSQLQRLVYGASDPKRGYTLYAPNALHPKTEVTSGIMADECAAIVQEFFKKRR